MKRNLFSLATLSLAAGLLFFACNNDVTDSSVVPDQAQTQPETRAYGDKTPITVVYNECNDCNPLNIGAWSLGDKPFYDVAILFAANIHADADGDPCLFFNDNVNQIMSDVNKYVRPLQAKGIKVLLGILGDHIGNGVSNLQTDPSTGVNQPQILADILAYAVDYYGLDGVDFDDEYSKYGTNGFPNWNTTSFSNLINALRAEMPAGKLITVFDYVSDTGGTSYINSTALGNIDYAWYPYFGANNFGTSNISGMPASKWSPQAINLNTTYNFLTLPYIQNRSQQAKDGGYGAIETYDLRPSSERSGNLNVLQRIATGAGFGTVTKTENDYTKDWTSGGATRTITKNDIN